MTGTVEIDYPPSCAFNIAPCLLLACKQIFSEALEIYYASMTFKFVSQKKTVAWLSRLPEKSRKAVRNLRYDTAEKTHETDFCYESNG